MYRPFKYQKDDLEYVQAFIQDHPFASFITNSNRLIATHIPVLPDGEGEKWRLFSHIANHNEQLKTIENDAEALLIFSGANAYISSSWYENKDISTWDYSAVHVNARIKIQTSEELENSLEKLVERFEKQQDQPLFYKDIPKKMLQDHLHLITGFWLEPFKVEGIAKLHQGYKKKDIRRTVEQLGRSDKQQDSELSEAIKKENEI